jgi:hypothetical protein
VRLLLLYFIPDVASALAFGLGHVQKNTIPFDKLWPVRYIACLQLFSNGGLADWLEMFSLNHDAFRNFDWSIRSMLTFWKPPKPEPFPRPRAFLDQSLNLSQGNHDDDGVGRDQNAVWPVPILPHHDLSEPW